MRKIPLSRQVFRPSPYFNTNILYHFPPRISTNQGNLAERFLKRNLHLFDKTAKRCISLFKYKMLHVHLPECCSCVGQEIRRVAHLYVSFIFGLTWFTCKQILPSNTKAIACCEVCRKNENHGPRVTRNGPGNEGSVRGVPLMKCFKPK